MTNKISFILDGETVFAKNEDTIWDVAKREGTIIPHLCHSQQGTDSMTRIGLTLVQELIHLLLT